MGFNLRRSKKLLPGVRINLTKNGLGVSVGPAHAKVSASPKKKVTSNLGIPGTGLRYTKVMNTKKSKKQETTAANLPGKEEESASMENDPFLNSRFNQEPKSLEEWTETNDDYQELLRSLKKAVEGKSDKNVASEFPAKPKEVVFLKVKSALTDSSDKKIDAGSTYLTNHRVVFMGLKRTSEWQFKNMAIFLPFGEKETALFQNTDHDSVTGVRLVGEDWFKFQFFLTMVYALSKYPPTSILEQMADAAKKYASSKSSL
jgi:hypothetical protein